MVVTPGQTANVDVTVAWEIAYAETVTVYSASRGVERVVDAPAAVSVVGEKEIAKQAAHGQLPKLLEFTPGAEVTQSGVYDYMFSLPVPRTTSIAAGLVVSCLIALPGMFIALTVAWWRWELPFQVKPTVVPAVLLILLSAWGDCP